MSGHKRRAYPDSCNASLRMGARAGKANQQACNNCPISLAITLAASSCKARLTVQDLDSHMLQDVICICPLALSQTSRHDLCCREAGGVPLSAGHLRKRDLHRCAGGATAQSPPASIIHRGIRPQGFRAVRHLIRRGAAAGLRLHANHRPAGCL